ncbi:hypothetical protein [Paraburkholderia flava]|uniref:hypothetical protein n=1 Tax=Paraburkholderia flava TaxID=2547393 RepID=UPI001060BFD0|nr:hypothetical protein [Paraburkholderia flava]
MKPLLRVVLIIDALLLLGFGLLFLLTPWASLYHALQLVQVQPELVGQAFGVALIGLAWLALHASIDGALTATAAKVVGHVNWLTGVLMLVWLLGLHTPSLTGFGQLVAVVAGAVLLVIGLGGVRLAGAVRRRERTRLADAAVAERERQAAKTRSVNERSGYRAEPVVDVPVTASSPRPVSPLSPQPVEPSLGSTTSDTSATGGTATRDATAEAAGSPRPPFHG